MTSRPAWSLLAGALLAGALLTGCTPAETIPAPSTPAAEAPSLPQPETAPTQETAEAPVVPAPVPPATAAETGPAPATSSRESAEVVSVVDGDTVKVAGPGGEVTLRLIGLDTPETKDPRKPVQCYGQEASSRAAELLTGQTVQLEYDETQGRTDRYGRTLAYLWLPDGTLYNERMVAEGYAHEYTYDSSYRHQARIRAAEEDARAAQRGLWSPTTCGGDTTQAADAPAPAPAPGGSGTDPQYPTCKAAKSAGHGPYTRGQDAEYEWYRDGDGDGVTCE